MLLRARHFEIAEDEQEDEQIIHAERFFDDVAGGKLQRLLAAFCETDQHAEPDCQPHPEQCPEQRFSDSHFPRLAAK